jgi:hypothetical protein
METITECLERITQFGSLTIRQETELTWILQWADYDNSASIEILDCRLDYAIDQLDSQLQVYVNMG